MAVIVIAYSTKQVDSELVRIYDDSTEKYFESADNQNTKDYISYLATSKGLTVDMSEIKIYASDEFDTEELLRESALAKLTESEKEVLGII